jgi:hypothetical protein
MIPILERSEWHAQGWELAHIRFMLHCIRRLRLGLRGTRAVICPAHAHEERRERP